MRRKNETKIFSLFGQCEAAAAQSMIDEGKLTRIEAAAIPESAAYNERGQLAYFAVIVPAAHLAEFNRRCEYLRA